MCVCVCVQCVCREISSYQYKIYISIYCLATVPVHKFTLWKCFLRCQSQRTGAHDSLDYLPTRVLVVARDMFTELNATKYHNTLPALLYEMRG